VKEVKIIDVHWKVAIHDLSQVYNTTHKEPLDKDSRVKATHADENKVLEKALSDKQVLPDKDTLSDKKALSKKKILSEKSNASNSTSVRTVQDMEYMQLVLSGNSDKDTHVIPVNTWVLVSFDIYKESGKKEGTHRLQVPARTWYRGSVELVSLMQQEKTLGGRITIQVKQFQETTIVYQDQYLGFDNIRTYLPITGNGFLVVSGSLLTIANALLMLALYCYYGLVECIASQKRDTQ
jgi:hypothetical protein